MTSTPPGGDPNAALATTPSDRLWLRSELMGTQVITRDTGRRLGVVGEVMVDVDRREVVALGLRDNPLTRFLPGLPRWMPLESIRQVGDVILVDSADSLAEGFNPERYSKVINCQVITEAGEQLGRVLGFSFDIETGELTTLVIGALGVPLLGEGVLSTWELAVTEIVSSGPDRIIVYEGAEEKLRQLGTGLLEKLGVGGASWEQEERERFRQTMVPVENQLAAGQPSTQEQQRRIAPATNRRLEVEEDYDYVEVEPRREREPLRQRRYLDDDRDPERETPSRYTTENEARGRDGWRRDDRAGSNRYEDDRFDADRQQNNRLETNPGRTDRYSQERFNPADFDADFDEERLNEARAKQMRPNHDRSSSTASSIPDNSQPYGDSRSNQTGAERYSDLRQSSEGAATASSRQSPTYPPQPLQRERDDRIEAERLDRDRNSDIYSGEARQRAAERRYVRDEGPLDVEPLAEDRPASRRSEASDDPW